MSNKKTSSEKKIYEILKDYNLKIGFCESCTGGLISQRFTMIPGVSSVFERGLIVYSNQSKIDELNVSKISLEKFGAVSDVVASEMCRGLFNKCDINISVSVTGIAGPSGGTSQKPVGLVYIGIKYNDFEKVYKFNFDGNRITVQNKTADKVYELLLKIIN